MNSKRSIFAGLLCLLLAFLGSVEARAQDAEIRVIITVNDRGVVTGITMEPASVTIGGSSAPGKRDGGTLKFVIEVRPPGSDADVGIVARFPSSPFNNRAGESFGGFGGPVYGNGEFSFSARVNVTEGTFPFTLEVRDRRAPSRSLPLDGTFTAQGVVQVVDVTPPRCGPASAPRTCGVSTCIQIPIQDQGSGLAEIQVTRNDNADVTGTDDFTPGTKEEVVVTATKRNELLLSRVQLLVTDVAGNSRSCDPVLTQVLRANGKPLHETYTGIPQEEHVVTIWNGNPGLKNLEILVNGRRYRVPKLDDGQEQTLDVSAAMIPGDKNIFVLKATGKPGGKAVLMIWDGQD